MANTGRFNSIYVAVTGDLRGYVNDRTSGLQPDEADWFLHLIDLFEAEYRTWGNTANPQIRLFLATFDQAGSDLRLAAHVFLHVGYDLPRMIANSYSTHPGIRDRAGRVFVRPGPRFLSVFLQLMRRGLLGRLPQLVGQVDVAQALGYWLIALRSVAWIHAEFLADSSDRRKVEGDMALGLNMAAAKALDKWWITGITQLDNAELVAAVPMLDRALEYLSPMTVAGVAAGAAGVMIARRRMTTAAIDGLGALVYRNLAHAFVPYDDDESYRQGGKVFA